MNKGEKANDLFDKFIKNSEKKKFRLELLFKIR